MVEPHEHLEFFTLFGTKLFHLLFRQQPGHTLFCRHRQTKGPEPLRSSGIGDELDDFFKGLHQENLKRGVCDLKQRFPPIITPGKATSSKLR
jgi:hypothetical protein